MGHYELMLQEYSDDALKLELNKTGCLDLDQNCKLKASTMQCEVDPVYMNKNCRLSCGICSPPPGPKPEQTDVGLYAGIVIVLVLVACTIIACCIPSCSRKTVTFP